MKSYQKLDKTIDYLIQKKDPYGKQSTAIHKELQIANDALEQHLILDKLVKDGYAFANVPKNDDTGVEYPNNPCYVITYEGLVFKESGGYKVEYAIRRRELVNRQIVSWLNPTWKILAFVALLGGLVKLGIELFK